MEKKYIFGPTFFQPKKKDRQKSRLKKKSKNAFGREGTPEHIADIAGIVRPVGPKLEFHHDPGDDAHGEHKTEHPDPELGHALVKGILRFEKDTFHHNEDHAQTDTDRREYIMERNCQRELNAGEQHKIHKKMPSLKIRCKVGIISQAPSSVQKKSEKLRRASRWPETPLYFLMRIVKTARLTGGTFFSHDREYSNAASASPG